MRGRWFALVVALACVTPAQAEPDGSCAAACQRAAQCKLAAADPCTARCQQQAAEATADGRRRLAAMAHSSCARLAPAFRPPPTAPPPASADASSDRRQWLCQAAGTYETRRRDTDLQHRNLVLWMPRSVFGSGIGKTEPLARTMAQASCGKQMSGLLTIEASNINNQTRVKLPCHVTGCTPPR